MDLHLDESERIVLQHLLTTALGDLRMEIAQTDNPEYRRDLRAQETTMKTVLDRLERAAAAR